MGFARIDGIMRGRPSARIVRAVVMAGILSVGATAEAATLVTAALRNRATGEFSCLFTNTSNRDVLVTITMIRMDGGLAAQAEPTLEPWETYHFKDHSPSGEATHCRFEFSGNAKYARALACVGTDAAGCTAVAPAE